MEQSAAAKKRYSNLVDEVSPNSNLIVNMLKAFVVGGLISCLGQFIVDSFLNMNYSKDDAGMYCSIILIFLGVLLTGLGIYNKIGKFAGAGSIVPITGFANSVAAPAIEFKKEGYVLGVGAKMFIVAGPVILYGTLSSIFSGLVYYYLK